MKHRSNPPTNHHSNSFRRLCPTMRANIILRGYRNYQPPIRYPLHRYNTSRMNLRWLLRRQSYSHTLFCLPLYLTIYYYSLGTSSPPIPTRNRLQQPIRNQPRLRQNPIPSILYNQRRTWPYTHTPCPTHISTIFTRHTR